MNGAPWVVQAVVHPAGPCGSAYEFANAATPGESNRASGSGVTLFQPRCGIRTFAGSRRQVPAMMPSPATPGVSSLASQSICIPRHTPSSGVPRAATSRMTVSRPAERSAAMPAPNAPTPGRTRRAAVRTTSGSAVTVMVAFRRWNAPVIEARFATRESTITSSLTRLPQRPLGGWHVVERCDLHGLPQGEGNGLERRFRAMVVVVPFDDLDVQRESRCRGERAQHVRHVLAGQTANRFPAETQ